MLRKTITALAMTATAVLLATSTAQAADSIVFIPEPALGAGSAEWTENGDKLKVCDLRADDSGVRGYIYVPDQPLPWNGTVLLKASDPSFNGADNCVSVSKNISETTALSIKVCLYRGSEVAACNYRRIR